MFFKKIILAASAIGILSTSAFANSINLQSFDYIIEGTQGLTQYVDPEPKYENYGGLDNYTAQLGHTNMTEASMALLGSTFQRENQNLRLMIDTRNILQFGLETTMAKTIDYEVSFIGRMNFKDVFSVNGLNVFLGGKIGTGKGKAMADSMTIAGSDNFGNPVSVKIDLPDKIDYSVKSIQLGTTYEIVKHVNLVFLGEIVGREARISNNIDRNKAINDAVSSGMNPGGVIDTIMAIEGTRSINSYNLSAGLQFKF